jgi:hypothetical protein
MKTRFLLILLSILLLSIGCVKEEEETECYRQNMLYLETMEEAYEQKIAAIRHPDGTWDTDWQCERQKNLALDFLEEYDQSHKDINNPDHNTCTAEELRTLNNILERLIMETETDAYLTYSCD